MNTLDINNILSGDLFARGTFRGTVARDEFLSFVPRWDGLFVFNTHDSTEPGEHWVAVRAELATRSFEFFDSYGRSSKDFSVVYSALKADGYDVTAENRSVVQGLTSDVCGDYCVYYCLMRSRGWSLEEIVQLLMSIPGVELRDRAVREMILSRYGEDAVSGSPLSRGVGAQSVLPIVMSALFGA